MSAFMISRHVVQGHLTSSLQLTMARYVCTKKEVGFFFFFLEEIKDKNISATLGSKQTKANFIFVNLARWPGFDKNSDLCASHYSTETPANRFEFCGNV